MGHLPRRLSGVCSFFFATREHDILYSDWGRRYSIDLYIVLTLSCILCTTVHVLLSYRKLSLF